MPQISETATQLSVYLLESLPRNQSNVGVYNFASKCDIASSSSSSAPTVDDRFIARNVFLMTIVNKMNSLTDVTVVYKDSFHMDKIVNIPSSFVIKKPCDSSSLPSTAIPAVGAGINSEFGCVFFKTQEEFSFLMSRVDSSNPAVDVACQFVLPPHLFEEAIRLGYGKPHPFAGMYHPILKMTVAPTLLSIFTPSTPASNEFLLNCVNESYLFAKHNL